MKTSSRRELFLKTGAAMVAVAAAPASLRADDAATRYGLIGKIKSVPGKREQLIEILLEGMSEMPGCLSYVVAMDPADQDGIWVTEVWDEKESHEASLSLPSVRAAIEKGRPLIAAFAERFETIPVGGHGLVGGS